MTKRHLADLESALDRDHWKILERLAGDGYRISGYWIIARPDGSDRIRLTFEGLDDLKVLPMEESYGCHAEHVADGDLYFAKGSSWASNLRTFMNALRRHTTARS